MPAQKRRPRYKPHRTIRIPEAVAAELEKLAEERASKMTTEAVMIIREYLERLGRWPPKPPGLAGRGR
jgi:rRNA-processing protein FCF1